MTNINQLKYVPAILILLVLLCGGCAATAVYVNGAPAGTYLAIGNIPSKNIDYYFSAEERRLVTEGDENGLVNFPINPAIAIELTSDVKELCVHIRIFNPQRKRYSLIETYKLINKENNIDICGSKVIYNGKFSQKDFVRTLPIINVEVGQYVVLLQDESGRVLAVIGKVTYKCKQGGSNTFDGLGTH